MYAGVCLLFVVFLWCYFVGYGLDVPRSKVATDDPGAELWKWIESLDGADSGAEKDVDWDARREKVREVLMVSWDSYEDHAWGMCLTPGSLDASTVLRILILPAQDETNTTP